MRHLALALSIALAGCYNPSLAPCELACSNSGACPDGLSCNLQNVCSVGGAMCTNPIDAAIVDVPEIDAPMNSVTIEMRDRNGDPLAAALVIFADVNGNQVAEMTTGTDGRASVAMLPGGSATAIRPLPRPGGGTILGVSTYLDLWPGAHIINQLEVDSTTRQVTVSYNSQAGAAQYGVHLSCTPSLLVPALSVNVDVPRRCTTFDVLVTAQPAGTAGIISAAFLPAQTGTSISISNALWTPVRMLNGQFTNVPSGAATRGFSPGVWITPTLSNTATFTELPIGTFNMVSNVPIPAGAGVAGQTVFTATGAGGQAGRQVIYDRFPSTATTLDRNYAGQVIPWTNDPSFTPATRRMLFSQINPTGFTPSPPSFFQAIVTYQKDATTGVAWRMIAPASRIVMGGNQFYIDFPDVPGDRTFEPNATTAPGTDVLQLWQVEAPAVREMIERFDLNFPDSNYFKITGLQHVTVSTSAPPTP